MRGGAVRTMCVLWVKRAQKHAVGAWVSNQQSGAERERIVAIAGGAGGEQWSVRADHISMVVRLCVLATRTYSNKVDCEESNRYAREHTRAACVPGAPRSSDNSDTPTTHGGRPWAG